MKLSKQVVAVAGAGNLGKYACEELFADDRFDVVVLTRSTNQWASDRNIPTHQTDYDEASLLSIFDSVGATAIISFINVNDSSYIAIHGAILAACIKSAKCKRLIPSEWIGNIEAFPLLPSFYAKTREPFRKMLNESSGVEWTLFNCGWLMELFLPSGKSYLPDIAEEFPIDPNGWRACIRGSGDEPVSWTSARELAKALVELLAASQWDQVTYFVGEWSTFNKAKSIMESFYECPLPTTYKSAQEITQWLAEHPNDEDRSTPEGTIACVEEWWLSGASACPQAKTLSQRKRFFASCRCSGLEDLLKRAKDVEFA